MVSQNLHDELCQINTLYTAWLVIKSKGSGGGIDKQTINSYDRKHITNLNKLRDLLISGEYISSPYSTFNLKSGTKVRKISLPTIQDKIVQQALKTIIEPIFEKQFSSNSYAYRPGKGTTRAIRRVLHETTNEKNNFVLKADIISFFDSISHGILFQKLSKVINDEKILEIIKLWIQNGQVDYKRKWESLEIGISQGSVISPLLANFYLSEADKFLEKQNISFIRYADDYLFLSSNYEQSIIAFDSFATYMRTNLLLELRNSPVIDTKTDKVTFLGVQIQNGKVFLSDDKNANILNKIQNSLIIRNQVIQKSFFIQLQSFKQYYGQLLSQELLKKFDNSVLKLLRSKLQQAYQKKQISSKQKVFEAVISVSFMSESFKNEQNEIAKTVSNSIKASKHSPEVQKKIETQKRQYQRFENSGLDLTVSTPGVYIGKTKRGIIVKQKGKIIKSIPVANLQNINIISDGVSFSTNLIRFCADNRISINMFNFNGKPFAKIVQPEFTNVKIIQKQIQAIENNTGAKLVMRYIYGKIKNQKNLIKYFSKYAQKRDPQILELRNKSVKRLTNFEKKLKELYENIPHDYQKYLFAIEANSASVYWSFFKKLLSPHTIFPGRHHQGATDLTNQMLNYGYGILYSFIWTALIKAKLDPNIGYLHSNNNNKPALVYDFIEEFRQQAVDRVVFSLINKKQGTLVHSGNLLKESVRVLMVKNILERINKVENYKGDNLKFSEIIAIQATQTVSILNEKQTVYKPYIAKW